MPPISSARRPHALRQRGEGKGDRRTSDQIHGTRRLLERYHLRGDERAREELITRFLPLARQLALRYYHGREPLDDLVQVASVGLVKAVDRFEVRRTTAFASYAVPVMLGELRRYFRDNGWALHVPRGLQERALAVDRTADRLQVAQGAAPTPAQIAEQLKLTVEEVVEAMAAARATDTVSLDAPRPSADGERDALVDSLGADDSRLELVEYREAIAGALDALPVREREILRLRFEEDRTQSEIAARLGVSQMQISRLLRRTLERLRRVAEATA
ncbi:SigB/SigF/SigG family RNA polymerase sigma factor [Conexibacter woesei]|uniref:RNA polymerase, sigma 28 subunit, Sig B/F/G subfamily n=1 Tax=Conexibacter woesei (strain DSM 14684 / CCUG 47730 / CIP 108061 / JCM 11494 / NBRC 100937 / ID131577) TaxID=469383 RepID=D3EZ99_CONWI|nr:SigB/SigF/SigG family RNA polymerase sigma factor [Conexibacter woesei]ADB51864.1 RNA polymerase, sigma 28 subunit, Sig B/F/G subfamily [Conexibacter woesei DSM 14684]